MVIYGEYLFLQNSIAGLMILMLTGKICGASLSGIRLLAGSILCGIYSFIIFYDGLSWLAAGLLKIAFSVLLIILVFPHLNVRNTIKTVLIFYIISFASGGIVIGSLYFFNDSGITARGVFYIGQITYIKIVTGMMLAWICIYAFALLLKEKLRRGRAEAGLRVTFGKRTAVLKGFVDTGNFLKDPISGRPVCIAKKRSIEDLIPREDQFCIIPYISVGNGNGLLSAVKPDKAILLAKGRKPQAVSIVLALSEGDLPMDSNGEQYDVLLHEALTEGGVLKVG